MVIFSLGFVASAIILTQWLQWGDAGLVWANILNLGARAFYAGMFVNTFFARSGHADVVRWRKAVPPLPVLLSFGTAALITRWSATKYSGLGITQQIPHVGVGVACIVGCLGAWYVAYSFYFIETFTDIQLFTSIRAISRNKDENNA